MEKIIWHIYAWVYDSILLRLIPYKQMMCSTYGALSPEDGKRYLDAGCGTGNFLSLLADSEKRLELIGADFSPAMIKGAEKKLKNKKNLVSLYQLDLNKKLPFEEAFFDGVACINVLYALKKPDFFIKEIRRVLKGNGELVLISPLNDPRIYPVIKEHMNILKNKFPKIWGLHFTLFIMKVIVPSIIGTVVNLTIKSNRNYNFFSEFEIRSLFIASGFKILTIKLIYGDQNFFLVAEKVSATASCHLKHQEKLTCMKL